VIGRPWETAEKGVELRLKQAEEMLEVQQNMTLAMVGWCKLNSSDPLLEMAPGFKQLNT
jgi:hypothetical protein